MLATIQVIVRDFNMKKLIALILIATTVATASVINLSKVETNKVHACDDPSNC